MVESEISDTKPSNIPADKFIKREISRATVSKIENLVVGHSCFNKFFHIHPFLTDL